MPNYRTGDVIELTYFLSQSEGKFNTFRGLVFGKGQPNNLREWFLFHTVIDSVNTSFKMKVNSPMLAKVEIVKYGSNKLRQKQMHIPKLELNYNRLQEPIVKGRGYKPRAELGKRGDKEKKESEKVKPKKKASKVQLDD